MNVAHHLRCATTRLAAASDSARLDAELLLAHVLELTRAALLARDEDELPPPLAARFEQLVTRRAAGEPVAYLLGRQGFWTLNLRVGPAVLIPRPDTECLLEWALQRGPGIDPGGAGLRVLDLGTGSGAIALALAQAWPRAQLLATDRSAAALDWARANARESGVENVRFLHGDWYAALDRNHDALLDLVLSNPPYIASGDPHLAALRFEPRDALVAGPDGLDDLRRITAAAPDWLKPGGWLMVEHGYDQGAAVRALFEAAGLQRVETRRDYGGQERVTAGQRP